MKKEMMIKQVAKYLSLFNDIKNKNDERILEAMEKIDRKEFMGKNKDLAYLNQAIPIGHGQTISQPSTVARMLSLLELKKTDKVLEIGTGSAWNAALLSYLSKSVTTIEIVPELAETSKQKLKKFGIRNVQVKTTDFKKLKQKFDKIIFTAGINTSEEFIIIDFAKSHLNNNGILICPYQSGPLIILKKKNDEIIKKFTEEQYVFVPLIINS